MDDVQERLNRLHKYEERERQYRIVGVIANGVLLMTVWLLFKSEVRQNRFFIVTHGQQVKLFVVAVSLVVVFITTLLLAFRLNKLEEEHGKTEPEE